MGGQAIRIIIDIMNVLKVIMLLRVYIASNQMYLQWWNLWNSLLLAASGTTLPYQEEQQHCNRRELADGSKAFQIIQG